MGGNTEDISILIEYMKKYTLQSGMIILNPSTRDCYDSWLEAMENPSVKSHSIAYQRMKWFNAHIDRNSGTIFDTSMLNKLMLAKQYYVRQKPYTSSKTKPICRWCEKDMNIHEKENTKIYQCKCTARIGHKKCGESFYKEYKGRCPVCRTNLLYRDNLSKYMFWSIDNKYKI